MNPMPNTEWQQRFPVLSMTEEELQREALRNPLVGQVEAAAGADHFQAEPDAELLDVSVLGPAVEAVEFSPPECLPQVVADEVARLINEGGPYVDWRHPGAPIFTSPEDLANVFDIDYLHSDLPRREALPFKEPGYTTEELRDEIVHRNGSRRAASRREAVRKLEQRYIREDLEAAVTGPIVKSVILYCRHPLGYSQEGRRPDGSIFEPALVSWPVPVGYTAFRIARMVAEYAAGCWWCDEGKNELDCAVMLVSTGGALRLFATCESCVDQIGDGPDYYLHGAYDSKIGFPPEDQR